MGTVMMNGEEITEALTDNVLNTRYEDIEQSVVDNTKDRILDMVGNAIGGAKCPGNPELAELVKDWGGKKEATILGYGIQAPVHNAAFINCIFGRSFDRGPLTLIVDGKRSPNHTTETTALTALALGESKGINGREFITAMVVGDDIAARLHIANERPQPGQAGPGQAVITRGTTETFGAAAIAGRLLGLDKTQMINAFGISVLLMGGGASLARVPTASPGSSDKGKTEAKQQPVPVWLGVNDPSFKAAMAGGGYEETIATKMGNGITAQRGIFAAQLAKQGWPGTKDPFFSERGGYYPGISSISNPERVTKDLGKRYHVEVVFKPYPGGKPTHLPTDTALAIVNNNDINTDDIAEAILHLSPKATAAHYAKPYIIGSYPTMNALWSYYFAVASALYRKSSIDENYTEEKIRDPKLQDLIKKVKLGDLDKTEGVELEVIMKDGRRFTEYASVASGEPTNPMSRDSLIAKFKEQVEFSQLIGQEQTDELLRLLEGLEKVDNVKKLVELACRQA